MRTRRFPLLAAIAFVLAVGVFAVSLGPRRVYWSRGSGLEGGWSIDVGRGRVVASRTNLLSSYISMPAEPAWSNAGGFSYERRSFPNGGMVGGKLMSQHAAVPLYPLPLATGLLLAWRVRRWRKTKAIGVCASCGYDLRATPDRCPECGTPT